MSLPLLPSPNQRSSATHQNDFGFSKEQMQAYGQQCRDAALEEAAIDAERYGHLWSGTPAKAFFELAEEIRSMK